ncbi:Nif3-like dinuclear metal center hexameric protein [Spirochaeta isovalerica]|uniref:GTP cyclohydrolase 1 type 2 homolog n=1 Tax=Spirochaeta isovalerica TaxID=150 RepID=A0A841RES8_9SPIO|nr:Nif3-like dinuclear metal center hexameric protein [Spirochaeta isovalerica]MBB6482585.1 dinuclear metal center YbgI/SA1388 family protein [Spirochaeta isovalerica]
MNVEEFDKWVRNILNINEMAGRDASLNGLQVGRTEKELKKIAFAVDASMESFRRASESGADMLFVHHGLYWGRVIPVTGDFYRRMEILIKNDLALYAAHLPLDMHEELGNNAGMAKALGLKSLEPFGAYKGVHIGWKGEFETPQTRDEITARLFGSWEESVRVLPFGKDEIRTVALISGSASHDLDQAIEAGADLYLTGEAGHVLYHAALEAGINVICGGHYATEVYGVKLLAEKIKRELSIETEFIDIPTGL